MSVVKKILAGAALVAFVCLALAFTEHPAASPVSPGRSVAQTPARADLAEAVFEMVLENARAGGMALGEPPTLCQACVAAHLGLPEAVMRERCARACALR
ncbi:hypothetical protein [Solidesulfovibrio alcoholivorans]|uniref:hypothetical protein n=1 Tax=Solidesulfovibrio alcoholivorans TaxID=81406 RepID=UPI0004973778|nr:hypothetical protein [Solidesulfovibrio alcoholivorans]